MGEEARIGFDNASRWCWKRGAWGECVGIDLGKLLYFGQLVRNVGYGRSVSSRRVGVTVRVIDRRDEEYRQTGFRSP